MKEIIGKTNKSTNDSLPNRLLHKDNSYVTDSIGMANNLKISGLTFHIVRQN